MTNGLPVQQLVWPQSFLLQLLDASRDYVIFNTIES